MDFGIERGGTGDAGGRLFPNDSQGGETKDQPPSAELLLHELQLDELLLEIGDRAGVPDVPGGLG